MQGEQQQDERTGWQLAAELATRVAGYRKQLGLLERIVGRLADRWSDPKAVEKSLGALGKSDPGLSGELAQALAALTDAGLQWLRDEREGRRARLARQLDEGARERGLSLLVVTKEPLEIRIVPLGARIDLEHARATLVFGRQELLACPADAEEIFQARVKALSQLERTTWSPAAFHRELREAWIEAAARTGGEGWVELGEILPRLALSIQTARWRLDPSSRNFTGYGKALFLYELFRLRAAAALSADGWRLTLGPATGASTRDKRRVFWVEDGEGRGAYHLTLRFVRDEEIHGTQR